MQSDLELAREVAEREFADSVHGDICAEIASGQHDSAPAVRIALAAIAAAREAERARCYEIVRERQAGQIQNAKRCHDAKLPHSADSHSFAAWQLSHAGNDIAERPAQHYTDYTQPDAEPLPAIERGEHAPGNPPEPAQGWRDIASAPNDESVILLAGGRFFCEAREKYVTSPTTAAWSDGAWLVGGTEGGYVQIVYDAPTHWQPLPSAPTTGGGDA